ncbi:ArnT family glycosyltransferase [Roseibium sp. LAB1]
MSVLQSNHMTVAVDGASHAGLRQKWLRFAVSAASVAGAALLLGALYGRLMAFGVRRDEMMFVPPAQYLPDWQLYSDAFFNHVPNAAWFYHFMHMLLGDQGLLGSARTGVFLLWVLLILAIVWITLRISRSWLLAIFSAVAVLAADPLLGQAGMAATNNLLPLPFAVLGIGLFLVETMERRPRSSLIFVAGVCLSLAAGSKVSAVVFIPPVALAAFLLPAGASMSRRLTGTVLPLAAGGLIGALPVIWYLLADPQLFLAHVLSFHTGPHIAYWTANAASEPGLAMGLGGKFKLAFEAWLAGGPLILATVLVYLFWVALRARQKGDAQGRDCRGQTAVVLAVVALAAALSFVPTPGYPQYYIQPLACLPILGALLYRQIGPQDRQQVLPVLCASMFVMLVITLPRLMPGLASLAASDDFTSARMLRGGKELQQALVAHNAPEGPVATFMPLYPMEAGLGIYPEFASGQFAYRIAPYTDAELASFYRMVGADGLAGLFSKEPPAAILVGYEPDLEAPMLEYARANSYLEIPVSELSNRYGEGRLFVRTTGGLD